VAGHPSDPVRAEYLFYNIHDGASSSASFFPPNALAPLLVSFSWNNYKVAYTRIARSHPVIKSKSSWSDPGASR
jgi:hypothetical protein